MELAQFIRQVQNFDGLQQPERLILFAWYLHTHRKLERFDQAALKWCYATVGLPAPDLSIYCRRLVERKPPAFLKNGQGYALAGSLRRKLDEQYGEHETVIVVSQLLKELPGKVSDEAERLFLTEALKCYAVQAFRAAIVMTWNLAYDHVLAWVMADAQRLADFNAAIPAKYPKKKGLVIAKREEFEELKEFEVIEVCGAAGLFASNNIKRILNEKLTKRNMAAHPSLIEVTRAQADDAITDLVNNVILKLA